MPEKKFSTMKISNIKDIGFLLKSCIFLNWFLVIMMFCIQFEARTRAPITFWALIVTVAIILTIWGSVLLITKKDLLVERFSLYFGISSLAYSIAFLWLFYETFYNIILISSPIYLIISIIGYITVVLSILFYRFNVYNGRHKDKAGRPNYTIIISITLICSIVFRTFFDSTKIGTEPFIMGISMLLLSYFFSFGVTQLFDYIIFKRFFNV